VLTVAADTLYNSYDFAVAFENPLRRFAVSCHRRTFQSSLFPQYPL
jgi:hypothetical protein